MILKNMRALKTLNGLNVDRSELELEEQEEEQ
jgi:hypothetical protein